VYDRNAFRAGRRRCLDVRRRAGHRPEWTDRERAHSG
jgi:hypothetical protein